MKPQSCVAFNPEALHNSNEELHHSHITVRKGGNRKNQSFFYYTSIFIKHAHTTKVHIFYNNMLKLSYEIKQKHKSRITTG